jgi:hypothetical protein
MRVKVRAPTNPGIVVREGKPLRSVQRSGVRAVTRGRAQLTVRLRDDVQSTVASWDDCPYRIARQASLVAQREREP